MLTAFLNHSSSLKHRPRVETAEANTLLFSFQVVVFLLALALELVSKGVTDRLRQQWQTTGNLTHMRFFRLLRAWKQIKDL